MSKTKPRWADMTDDDLSIPVTISKHGIKVRVVAPSVPPPPDKTKNLIEHKK
jgi:hypothetical protein